MRSYVKVFVTHNGDAPWPCDECGEPVAQIGRSANDGNVHHVDGDYENESPSNLVMMHKACHLKHHHIGQSRDPESIRRTVTTRRARHDEWHSEETRRKISAANIGKPGVKSMLGRRASDATRQKMREADRKPFERRKCLWCDLVTTPGAMMSHIKSKHSSEMEST